MSALRRVSAGLAVLSAAALITTGCSSDSDDSADSAADQCATLSADQSWYGDNAARINEFFKEYGPCAGADAKNGATGKAPLALFDWDNTVVRNDIGNATFQWMIKNDKIRQPARRDWGTSSPLLTAKGKAALNAACDDAGQPGQPLVTSTNATCADELLSIYNDAETKAGDEAFGDHNRRNIEPAYAWLAQLFAGWKPADIASFADAARTESLAAPVGATEKIGTTEVDSWVRYYDQIKDLIAKLQKNGFDVRIISASPQAIVDEWAGELGLAKDKLMGIKGDVVDGVYTSRLPGCGGQPDNSIITYIDGKRCRVNEEVLGITGPKALEQAPAQDRQVFAAGDSDTDLTFLGDATGLRLAINRNKTALMCQAYFDGDGKWIVNPMFIKPEGAADGEYKCATEGGVDAAGADVPAKYDGKTIPDQRDTVHG